MAFVTPQDLDVGLSVVSDSDVRSAEAITPRARYRPDIDGLRAVAVVSVILTHAGIARLSGGFVGVDIFFVISGYLIHRDLVSRLAAGRLSPLAFYGRRMRRTLPALYFVATATLLAALFVLMPGELDDMAHSFIGAILLVPNIVFFTQTGYFDQLAHAKPLLHTWSLGVEEQFYLFAPLLALALARFARPTRMRILWLAFGCALSFTILLQRSAPAAAFYLMPARVFEFLIGVLLAEGSVAPVRSGPFAEVLAAVALAAIGVAVARFSDATAHPGVATLLPCLGTAALIHVGSTHRTFIGSALSHPLPSFLGLISYSLYLWHWPIIVLTQYADVPRTPTLLAVEGVLLLAGSTLSWRYVETPFRDPKSVWRQRARTLLPVAAAPLAGACALIVAMSGLPGRLPPDVAAVASYYTYRDHKPFREGQCFITSKNSLADFDRATCLKMRDGAANVLLIGDSQAAHLWTGLADAWPTVNFLQATASGCKPVLGAQGASRCTAMMRDMLEDFIPHHHLDAVAIGGLWESGDLAPLLRTLKALTSQTGEVVVFGPMPRYDQPVATLIAKSLLRGNLTDVLRHRLPETEGLDTRMHDAIAPIATYVSTYQAMCPGGACRLFAAARVPMQFDYHHLTKEGAAAMMATIKETHADLFLSR